MADFSDEKLELMERQLAERVSERVRSSLFKLYASVGVAVIGVIGFVNWDIVADIKAEIKQEIDGDIAAKRAEIAERVTETRIIARRANELIQRVEKQLDEFEPQAENLDETIQKVKSLNVDSQDMIANYSREFEPLVKNVEFLSQKLVKLAKQVDELNTLSAEGNASNGIEPEVKRTTDLRSEAIKSVIDDSKMAEKLYSQARTKPTVFLQFAGGRREQAKSLSAALISDGYIVPGEERESGAAGKREVRYFHDADAATAQELAENVDRVLSELGYSFKEAREAKAKSLVSYGGKKPRAGVLELWIELPPM
ncbi:hypothetical protein SAMN02745866_01135 [Alteromonadaceae bacterium Bs31]|nr:hypothetical protein SAMN02745866_01135 [Alteromonadaceae bacterium Bs31]